MMTTSTRVEDAKLHEMQQLAGLPFPPTEATYAFRQAVNGEGDHAFDWQDKPHRLVYDLCRIIEADAAANAALRSEILELRATVKANAEAMRRALGCLVFPVSTEIDPRGYSAHGTGGDRIDYAAEVLTAALEQSARSLSQGAGHEQ